MRSLLVPSLNVRQPCHKKYCRPGSLIGSSGCDEFIVNSDNRIAQLIILPILVGQPIRLRHIDSLGVIERGTTVFGLSGRA